MLLICSYLQQCPPPEMWLRTCSFLDTIVIANGCCRFAAICSNVFATVAANLQCIRYFVTANGCYQFAGIRSNVFEIFAMNLKLFRYVVLANGCCQFAFIRGKVFANGCYQFAGNCQHRSSKCALANGCYQFAPSSLPCVSKWMLLMGGDQLPSSANGCHQFAVSFSRYSVLANGSCTLKVIRYPVYANGRYRQAVRLGHYISAWVLPMCSLSATLPEQMVAINPPFLLPLQLDVIMNLQIDALICGIIATVS